MLAAIGMAQNYSRQASIVGGGSPDRGKCTIEVVVDGAAEVEVQGLSGTVRTLSGRPVQWRRFECTAPLPPNPAGFRFAGVDGRGRQSLIRDPRSGGVAVIRIEDRDSGAEGYTFDLFWDTGVRGGAIYPSPYESGQYRPNYRESEYYRRYQHGFGADEAVRVCEQSIVDQASRRFRTNDVHLHRVRMDDNPGRGDWVTGVLDVHRRYGAERFGFSCSVDFDSGRVRSAVIDSRPLGSDIYWP